MEQTAPARRCLAPTVERTTHNAQRTSPKANQIGEETTGRFVPHPVFGGNVA